MFFNIEIAQKYTAEKLIKQDSFYSSMLKSFNEVVDYTEEHGIQSDFTVRIDRVVKAAEEQKWFNTEGFKSVIDKS